MGKRRRLYGLDAPVHGHKATSTSLSASELEAYDPTDQLANLAAPGAGQEYHVEEIHIACNVGCTLTLYQGDAGSAGADAVIVPAKQLPAGFGILTFPGRGLAVGQAKVPKISASATGGGNVIASIEVFGVVGPS